MIVAAFLVAASAAHLPYTFCASWFSAAPSITVEPVRTHTVAQSGTWNTYASATDRVTAAATPAPWGQ